MYENTCISSFSSAHRLRNYKGKCESLHGHTWKLEVTISGEKLDKIGLLYDFTEMKKNLKYITKTLDHKYLNEISPFDKINPSSENIAKYIYQQIKKIINKRIHLVRVTVWESDSSFATYYE